MHRSTGGPRTGLAVTALLALIAPLSLTGCQTYEPAPLAPDDILIAVETRRHVAPREAAIPLAEAVALMRERSPALLPLREAETTARQLADMGTPLPNPSIGLGPILLSGADVTGGTRWGMEVVGGWLLDLAGNRSAATSVREAEADQGRVERAATERETYLALRRAFTRLAAAQDRSKALDAATGGARATLDVANRLVEAAQATALDVREIAVEMHLAAADGLATREDETDARAALAAESGVAAEWWTDVEAPTVPPELPERDALVAALLAGHPELDRLRAEYAVAEAGLRAEVAAQFPGLELEPGYEYEEKTDRYSLGLGFELPVFDRNQLGIAAAEGRRREVRARFEASVARQLADIDAGLARLTHRLGRLRILADEAEPAARDGLRLAAGALRSGSLDGLRYLTVARTEREVRLAAAEARQAVLEAWCDLESACGAPLLGFPSVRSSVDDHEATGEDR